MEEIRNEKQKYYGNKKEDFNFKQGLALFKARKYKEAKEYFESSIEAKGSSYKKSIFFLGKIYIIEKKLKKAEEELEKYIELDKDRHPHGRLELGRLYVKEGEYEKAKEEFKKCIEINANDTHARLELGRVYVKVEAYEEAEEEFNRYIELDKDQSPHGRLELGRLYEAEGEYEKAEEEFEKCIEIDKDRHPHGRLELGRVYVLEGAYEKAKEEFEECIQIDEYNVHARLELGRLYVKVGEYEKAKGEFEECIERNPKDSYAKEQLKRLNDIQYEDEERDKILTQNEKKEIEDIFNKQIEEKEVGNDTLSKIRDKIKHGTIKTEDIKELEAEKEKIGARQYYLIQIAINARLGNKEEGLRIIKQMEREGLKDKTTNKIKEELKSKRKSIYDLGKWDEIIGWDTVITECEEKEMKESKKEIEEEENGKKELKEETAERSTKKVKNIVTIEETMSERLRKTVDEIKMKYYAKQNKYIERYDKLETILGSSTENKRAQMELMMILINEGYKKTVEETFPEEDYRVINEMIEEYKNRKIEETEFKQKLDEYCI